MKDGFPLHLQLHDAGDADTAQFGERGARLARLARLGLPVPTGRLFSAELVSRIAEQGAEVAAGAIIAEKINTLPPGALLAVRGSPPRTEWGGPAALLNLGITDARFPALVRRVGEGAAHELYFRLIAGFAITVRGMDPDEFENLVYDQVKYAGVGGEADLPPEAWKTLVTEAKALFADDTDEPFPDDATTQVIQTIDAMSRAWHARSAKLLRSARGAPEDAGLALILQRMAFGVGAGEYGAGVASFVDQRSGVPLSSGRFLPNAQGTDVLLGMRTPHLLTEAAKAAGGQRAASLEELVPAAVKTLEGHARTAAKGLGEQFSFEFTIEDGSVWLLDGAPAPRSARASVRIAVDLAQSGAISREDALLRVEPRNLVEHLHPQIDPDAPRDVVGVGLAASPGAATGKIVFRADDAQVLHAQGEAAILVRVETSPEDIRGMHSASAVLTVRGGMTSHAAVIARGLGLPCVVGASDLTLDTRKERLTTRDGRSFGAGDVITLDGTRGEILEGAPAMVPAEESDAVETLLSWSDQARSIGVRANADTPDDARTARRFKVDGIGLCRTEHMFFHQDRITPMREMILAEDQATRQRALDRLLPMQRADFVELFEIMRGLPVTIRLLDPPLHEFLPHDRDEIHDLAEAMDVPVRQIIARTEAMSEFNPMLGKRGVRLGVTMPEIYDMQARAIFEAAAIVNTRYMDQVVPEIMIPLVSAVREVDLVKSRVDAIAAAVMAERELRLEYKLGIMVETPRAALRANDLALSCAFLSFGTNDLTQMTYGLSRDDAGRFMRDYVGQGVFPEDPFHSLDVEGVGELLLMAAKRGRETSPNITLGLCGEHGGDPSSIRFCTLAGFDYVSCSPFRVPIARLAAAQATILARQAQ
ncbi:MAG: pyruvate, phosphate dikinase [Pseudomonadota bacterium]